MTRWAWADCECCGRKGAAAVIAGAVQRQGLPYYRVRCDVCRRGCRGVPCRAPREEVTA